MGKINDVFRAYGPEYLARYQDSIPALHRKIIHAIIACRTDACGLTLYQCTHCGEPHWMFRSCGNRHCPQCQYQKNEEWLNKRLKAQLPGHHFLITFTVPESLRPSIRSHQRATYAALFKAFSEAMMKLARDEKYIGGDLPGFFGVLHTWGRQLTYHPHIHYVVAGGALSTEDGAWHPSRVDFYLPVKALSVIYRAKFRDEMGRANLLDLIPEDAWSVDWNVNCQAVGGSEASVKYLAPYVFRVAISDNRIVKVENRTVFFHYRKPHSHRLRIMALDVMEFIRRFLQHVLPSGFMKIRYYGFMNPNTDVSHEHLSTLIELAYGFRIDAPPKPDPIPVPLMICPQCGGHLIYRWSLRPCPHPP